jgi:hypothetical protein
MGRIFLSYIPSRKLVMNLSPKKCCIAPTGKSIHKKHANKRSSSLVRQRAARCESRAAVPGGLKK